MTVPSCELPKYRLPSMKQSATDFAFIVENEAQIWPVRSLMKGSEGKIKGDIAGWTVQIFVGHICIQPTKPTLSEAVQAAREKLCNLSCGG